MVRKRVRWLIRSYILFYNMFRNQKQAYRKIRAFAYMISGTKLKGTKLKQDLCKVARMRKDGPL